MLTRSYTGSAPPPLDVDKFLATIDMYYARQTIYMMWVS